MGAAWVVRESRAAWGSRRHHTLPHRVLKGELTHTNGQTVLKNKQSITRCTKSKTRKIYMKGDRKKFSSTCPRINHLSQITFFQRAQNR